MSQSTVARIVKRCKIRINRLGCLHQETDKFEKADDFWKKLIRESVYNFYENKFAQTIDALYKILKEISTGTHYEFSHGRTTLYHLLKKLGFKCQKGDNRKVLMETPRIIAWR